jgi:hypothetical protein
VHEGQQDGDKPRGLVKGGGVPGYEGGGEGCRGWVSISHLLLNCRDETSSDFQLPLGSRSQQVSFLRFSELIKRLFRIWSHRLHITRLMKRLSVKEPPPPLPCPPLPHPLCNTHRAGHSLIFSGFAIRFPLNFFPWIADAHAFIF